MQSFSACPVRTVEIIDRKGDKEDGISADGDMGKSRAAAIQG